MATILLRDVKEQDLDEVLAINESEVPRVARIPRERLEWFCEHAHRFRVADDDGRIAGFLIALLPDAPYDSIHFGWFRERYQRFIYVDRIAIAASAQRGGIGRRFYDELADTARSEALERITAEVNIDPPNPASLAFHRDLGFTEVGTQDAAGGKRVSLVSCEIR